MSCKSIGHHIISCRIMCWRILCTSFKIAVNIQFYQFFKYNMYLPTVMKFAAKHNKFVLKGMRRQSEIDSSGWRIYYHFFHALSTCFLFLNLSNDFFYILLQINIIVYNKRWKSCILKNAYCFLIISFRLQCASSE